LTDINNRKTATWQTLPFGQHIKAITQAGLQNLPDDESGAFLKALSSVSKFAFDEHFCDFASKLHPCFNILQLVDPAFKSTDAILSDYDDHFFNKNGLAGFLEKYPLVKSLQQDMLQQLTAFETELRSHIQTDADSLSQVFNNNQPIGLPVKISTNQGDVHNGGKSTAIVEFTSGIKMVYKPRSGAMDVAFNTFIRQVATDTGIDLKTARVLDRADYFWMEYIEHLPVANASELSEYHTQCGALLAIVFLLGGTDFHFENIIACGKHPVLIDLECLFGATTEMEEGIYSVNNTGLVPANIYLGEQDAPIDNSGFGACGRQVSGIDRWAWVNIGTDALRLEKQKGIFTADANQPLYNGSMVSPQNYLAEITNGFKEVCNWFITNRDVLDTPDALFSNFKDKPIRVIARYTMNYLFMIENSLNADALLSEEVRKQEIYRSLNEFPTATLLRLQIKALINDAEFEAIKRMNVPLFTGNTSKLHIRESGDYPEWAFFETTPYQFTLNRIKSFDGGKMQQQVSLITSAFAARYGMDKATRPPQADKNLIRYSRASISKEIQHIADDILSSAIKNNNTFSWNGYTADAGNKLILGQLSPMLYDGSLGIACFLNTVNGDANKPLIDTIIAAQVKLAFKTTVDISFASGLAGLLYALVKSHRADNHNLQTAIALTLLIEPAHIKKDTKYDVMAGSAGLLLSLATLYKATGSADILELMVTIAHHLLQARVMDSASRTLTWRSEQFDRPLTGFSHGASGIACALLTLYDITGIEKYKQAFYQSIQFENYYRNAGRTNWCDLRKAGYDCKSTWCHGAPGIGLARLHAYQILKDEALLRDVETAIATTKKYLLSDTDFYCCGNTGRIDFLIEAAQVLGRPSLLQYARKALVTIVNRKNKRGWYQTYNAESVGMQNPSLFRGTAGIGYTLLRSMQPGKVACLGLLA
jgi:type 2 lantibiotic biosynthesis protein LanM